MFRHWICVTWETCLNGLWFGCLMLALASDALGAETPEKLRVYIGTNTGPDSQGIYMCELDLATGQLSEPRLAGEAVNPSFLALHPTGKFMYSVGQIEDSGGQKLGGVNAFSVDAKSGKLTLLNQQSSEGAGPCHLVVDAAGKAVLVANYGGGSVASLAIGADGRLAPASSAIKHQGQGSDPAKVPMSHAHSINLDAANRFAFCADLGLDQVLVYRFDADKATLTPHDPPFTKVAEGAGPRHFAFHPGGKFAYVINELGNTVTGFNYDADKGVLTELQTIGTLPDGYNDKSYTAEVVVHPTGKFLYGSNRGHDSIAIFSIDQATGKLTATGHESTGGKWPRNFNIDPTGKYLLAENAQSNSIVVFTIDQAAGTLTPTGQSLTVPQPVCIKFAKP
ncbi:MAG: lactonase family protein [Pirellulales bacterium]